jgi:DNA-binding transcriptional MocR family regulator
MQPLFAPDDFTAVKETYFADLGEEVDAEPSGWLCVAPDALRFASLPRLTRGNLVRYCVDEGPGFPRKYKEQLGGLLSAWEGRPLLNDEFTVCPSGTCASLVVLATLKALGVGTMRFETPTYYAAIEQADAMELVREMIPAYHRDGYCLPSDSASRKAPTMPMALWLTQPRFSLGIDQSSQHLGAMLRALRRLDSYLIVDEVMDQSFPARLAVLGNGDGLPLIRIKSFFKAIGFNGLRLAAILHPPRLRKHIVNALEMFGGAVDAHSLSAVAALSADVPRFSRMLAVANEQVNRLRGRAERLVRGTPLSVNPLRNGYVGSMVADLSAFGTTREVRRRRLLEGCRRVRTPIVLGASFYAAIEPPTETIRLNFFTPADELLRGIRNTLSLWRS